MTSLRTLQAAMREQPRYVPGAIPAPVLGWNARDALDGMHPAFAVQLDNFFAYNGYVALRGGSQLWTGGLGGAVRSLARWADAAAEKAIAGAGGQLWEVSPGAGVSLGTGYASDVWQSATTKGSRTLGTAYLYMVGLGNVPQAYDGTTVAPVTWAPASGQPALDLTKLHNVTVAKDLLLLAESGQLGFWHSAKGDVSPAAELSWFDLGTVLSDGGELVAIGSMTLEGGEGPDDYTCFVASTGQVALYQGNDPAQATDWGIIGRFPLGRALGPRCILEIAGDVIVLTVNGYISLRQFMQIGGLQRQSFAFNDNIQPEVVRQTRDYGSLFGWQPVLVPGLTLALFNVPQSSDNYVQHVVNTQTAAWSRITDWNGLCWLNMDAGLIFGTSGGAVHEANVGGVDVGAVPVHGVGTTAFSDFGARGQLKQFQLCRAILETIGDVDVRMAIAVDYDQHANFAPVSVPPAQTAGQWDVSEWDTAEWEGAPVTRNDWQSVPGLGYAAALSMDVVATGTRCRWKSTTLSYTPGGLM